MQYPSGLILLFLFIWSCAFSQKDSLRVYLKCRNDLMLDYIFPSYQPTKDSIQIKGGRLLESNEIRIAIVPDSSVVVIHLKQNGRTTPGALLYSVQPPPPVAEITIDNKSYFSFRHSATGPIPASGIIIKPVADVSFESEFPNDSYYKILKWEIRLKRNSRVMYQTIVTGEKLSAKELMNIRATARTNDILQIKVLEVKRRNALGEMIDQQIEFNTLSYMFQ